MVYGTGTRSYNRSAEKREIDRQRAAATAQFAAVERPEVVVGPICTCRSFNLPHELKRHQTLKSEMDWRTEQERRGISYERERVK